jgi:hypothetical protein
MSVEQQRLYVAGVDQLKKAVADTVADMLSAHQQLKSAVHHNNMLGVQGGIEVLQRYAIVLTGAARQVPPTPGEGSDFDAPVEYPAPNLPSELHVNKEMGGIEDLSETKEDGPVFVTEPPQPIASRRRKA